MDKLEKKSQISEFAKNLARLAESAPDGYARKDLFRTIHRLRQRYAVSPEKKRETIINLLAEGLTSFDELLSETGFTRHQVQRELTELKNQNKIREAFVMAPNGRGRPAKRYFLTAELAANF